MNLHYFKGLLPFLSVCFLIMSAFPSTALPLNKLQGKVIAIASKTTVKVCARKANGGKKTCAKQTQVIPYGIRIGKKRVRIFTKYGGKFSQFMSVPLRGGSRRKRSKGSTMVVRLSRTRNKSFILTIEELGKKFGTAIGTKISLRITASRRGCRVSAFNTRSLIQGSRARKKNVRIKNISVSVRARPSCSIR